MRTKWCPCLWANFRTRWVRARCVSLSISESKGTHIRLRLHVPTFNWSLFLKVWSYGGFLHKPRNKTEPSAEENGESKTGARQWNILNTPEISNHCLSISKKNQCEWDRVKMLCVCLELNTFYARNGCGALCLFYITTCYVAFLMPYAICTTIDHIWWVYFNYASKTFDDETAVERIALQIANRIA